MVISNDKSLTAEDQNRNLISQGPTIFKTERKRQTRNERTQWVCELGKFNAIKANNRPVGVAVVDRSTLIYPGEKSEEIFTSVFDGASSFVRRK